MGEGVEGWSPVLFTYHLPQSEVDSALLPKLGILLYPHFLLEQGSGMAGPLAIAPPGSR